MSFSTTNHAASTYSSNKENNKNISYSTPFRAASTSVSHNVDSNVFSGKDIEIQSPHSSNINFLDQSNHDGAANTPEKGSNRFRKQKTNHGCRVRIKSFFDSIYGGKTFPFRCLCFCVGFGNIAAYPLKVFKYGAAFIIAYFVCMALIGLPSVYLEVALGQYTSSGPVSFYAFSALFAGTGIAVALTNIATVVYYCQMCGNCLFYLMSSVVPPPQWSISNTSNMMEIQSSSKASFAIDKQKFLSCLVGTRFYKENIEEPDTHFNTGIFICVFCCWLICWVFFRKAKSKSADILYHGLFTLFCFAISLVFVLLFQSLTKDGSLDGIQRYIEPRFEDIFNIDVWIAATKEVFFSMYLQGCFAVISMYNDFHYDFCGDVIIVVFIEFLFSFIPGFTVFSYIGVLSKRCTGGISDLSLKETTLTEVIFVYYPSALSELDYPGVMGILFFLMVFIIAMTSQFVLFDTVLTAVKEQIPWLSVYYERTSSGLCIVLCCMAIPFCTKYGHDIFNAWSSAATGFNNIFLQLVTFLVLSWIYGSEEFLDNVELMRKKGKVLKIIPWRFMRAYLHVMWKYVCPMLMVSFLFVGFYKGEFSYNDKSQMHFVILIVLQSLPILVLVISIMVTFFNAKGSLSQKWKISTQPTIIWGPALVKLKKVSSLHRASKRQL